MFDPYHKWLGIRPGQRPPTHYQLLGIAPDEQDAEVIEEAAIRQSTHLRAYQIGPHAADCTRLLNEISLARATLLNPAKRKAYDAQLSKLQQAGSRDPAAQVTAVPPPPLVPPAEDAFADMEEAAAQTGVKFENTSDVEPLVVLRYFGPEVNPEAPEMGAYRKNKF